MDEWREIASAPKDGTAILVSIPKGGESYLEKIDVQTTVQWFEPWSKWLLCVAWGYDAELGLPANEFPTHWMPLPAPPKAKA